MSERTELDWIEVGSTPPWSREDLERLHAALVRAGLTVSLAPEVQGGTRYQLMVRPQDVDLARQIVLNEERNKGR